jgi:hypothetical protein
MHKPQGTRPRARDIDDLAYSTKPQSNLSQCHSDYQSKSRITQDPGAARIVHLGDRPAQAIGRLCLHAQEIGSTKALWYIVRRAF